MNKRNETPEPLAQEHAGEMPTLDAIRVAMEAGASSAWLAALEILQAKDAEIARLKADAGRYRWLRSRAMTEGRDGGTTGFWRLPFIDGWGFDYKAKSEYHYADLDAATDAAIRAQLKASA